MSYNLLDLMEFRPKSSNLVPRYWLQSWHIINLSFSQGCFPSCLKAAKVIPVHKGGDKTDMNNYRPISLPPVISKVFERAMYCRIYGFLESYKLLCDSQYGFRSKRSAVDAVAHIIERIRTDHDQVDYTCILLIWKRHLIPLNTLYFFANFLILE